MAMTVMNNPTAMMTLGELNKNVSKLGKQLKKVATGTKITSAGDDTSGYAISERMQARIRSLQQDESNVKTGMSMLKVASGGIESIVEELRSLKELAINAANDSNTAIDRATIQKEFDQRRENIDNIAVETNYNGKMLLTGIYSNQSVDVTTTTVIPGTAPNWLTPTNPSAVGPTGAVVHSGSVEPTGTPIQITAGTYTITSSGVYELTNDSHNITIDAGAHDVKFVQASGATLTNVHIVGPMSGTMNLWIEDLTVTNNDLSHFIIFKGSDNFFNFKGTNTIKITGGNTQYAIIDMVNADLTIEGGDDGMGVLSFDISPFVNICGALIGSSEYGISNTSNITVNSGTYKSEGAVYGRFGAFIGSGTYAGIGDLTVNGGTFYDEHTQDVIIGSGSGPTKCGNIIVRNAVIIAPNKIADTAIGSGANNGKCGDIYVSNSRIDVKNNKAAGIGTSYGAKCGNITVENTELSLSSITGAGIGSGELGSAGDITINNCDITKVVSEQGEYVGRGVNGTVGTVTVNGEVISANDPSNQMGVNDIVVKSTKSKMIGKPLVVHDGTQANQEINFYINDMRTSALKGKITNESGEFIDPEDLDRLRNLCNDPATYKAYADILREADGKTLDDVSVTTQHGASVAMRVIDGAIQYALDEATTIGAYISRLEYTADNIVVSNENTVSSESTIRDADMAKEMTAYTKSNILAQAAQSMLAQANQNSSSVLSLLQ